MLPEKKTTIKAEEIYEFLRINPDFLNHRPELIEVLLNNGLSSHVNFFYQEKSKKLANSLTKIKQQQKLLIRNSLANEKYIDRIFRLYSKLLHRSVTDKKITEFILGIKEQFNLDGVQLICFFPSILGKKIMAENNPHLTFTDHSNFWSPLTDFFAPKKTSFSSIDQNLSKKIFGTNQHQSAMLIPFDFSYIKPTTKKTANLRAVLAIGSYDENFYTPDSTLDSYIPDKIGEILSELLSQSHIRS